MAMEPSTRFLDLDLNYKLELELELPETGIKLIPSIQTLFLLRGSTWRTLRRPTGSTSSKNSFTAT